MFLPAAAICSWFQLSLKNKVFKSERQDVKIAYYNDNNTKRYRQKSALFAIANRVFQAHLFSLTTRRFIFKIDCYMKQNYSVSFPAFKNKCWQFFSLFFFLFFTVTNVFAQTPVHVGGTVWDNKGAPIAGVSVTVKGSVKGTSTDNSGAFTIDV